jgi:hypothetical protein
MQPERIQTQRNWGGVCDPVWLRRAARGRLGLGTCAHDLIFAPAPSSSLIISITTDHVVPAANTKHPESKRKKKKRKRKEEKAVRPRPVLCWPGRSRPAAAAVACSAHGFSLACVAACVRFTAVFLSVLSSP